MKRRKYNYRFVCRNSKYGRKLYRLELIGKKRVNTLEKYISNYFSIGDYVVYRKYNDGLWYARNRNDNKEIFLGYYWDNKGCFGDKYSFYAHNKSDNVRFFNSKGDFFQKNYRFVGESRYSVFNQYSFLGYNNDGTCDVFMVILIGAKNNIPCLDKYCGGYDFLLKDAQHNIMLRYVAEKQSWEIVDEKEYSWYQKIWRTIMKALC